MLKFRAIFNGERSMYTKVELMLGSVKNANLTLHMLLKKRECSPLDLEIKFVLKLHSISCLIVEPSCFIFIFNEHRVACSLESLGSFCRLQFCIVGLN